jgi:outer membrane biosynthesis protein TonB
VSDGGATPATSSPEPTTPSTTTAVAGAPDAGTKLGDVSASAPGGSSPTTSDGGTAKGAHTHDAGRGPKDIQAIVVAHRDEARACYDRAVADHPGIEGDLVIQWTIDPKGAVTLASVDTARSKITEPTVVSCIVGIIQKVQFAASPGGFETKASYPFNFHPHHGKP